MPGISARSRSLSALLFSVAERLDGPPVDATEVAEQARRILSDPRYASDEPSFLQRVLGPVYDWFELMLAFAWEMATRAIEWLFQVLTTDVMTLLGPILVLVVAGAAAWILARRRAREIERRATIERILELGADPAELEARAQAAHEQGDYSEAIRLRFVAGLLRLDAEGTIEFYPGLSNGAISDRLADPVFDGLAARFDQVVYGRRPASRDDSQRAEDGWLLLVGARR